MTPWGARNLRTAPAAIAFDRTNVWVANLNSNNVMRLNTDGTVAATYRVGKDPMGVLFDGASMWAANFGSDSVSTTLVAAP